MPRTARGYRQRLGISILRPVLFGRENVKAFSVRRATKSAIKTHQRHSAGLSSTPLQRRSQLKRVRRSERVDAKQPFCDNSQAVGGLYFNPCTRKFMQHVSRLSFAGERDAAFPRLPSKGRNAFGACCPPNHGDRVVGENRFNGCA